MTPEEFVAPGWHKQIHRVEGTKMLGHNSMRSRGDSCPQQAASAKVNQIQWTASICETATTSGSKAFAAGFRLGFIWKWHLSKCV